MSNTVNMPITFKYVFVIRDDYDINELLPISSDPDRTFTDYYLLIIVAVIPSITCLIMTLSACHIYHNYTESLARNIEIGKGFSSQVIKTALRN